MNPTKLRAIVAAMVEKAVRGDVAAAKLILSYTLGEPVPHDFEERLRELHEAIKRLDEDEDDLDEGDDK